jgi:hypothetical protein
MFHKVTVYRGTLLHVRPTLRNPPGRAALDRTKKIAKSFSECDGRDSRGLRKLIAMLQSIRINNRQLWKQSVDFTVIEVKPVGNDLPKSVSISNGMMDVHDDLNTVIHETYLDV